MSIKIMVRHPKFLKWVAVLQRFNVVELKDGVHDGYMSIVREGFRASTMLVQRDSWRVLRTK